MTADRWPNDPSDPQHGFELAGLVRRASRAGATGASDFADWLIIDEEWFGPCDHMDAATYRSRRRRAMALYAGRLDPRTRPRRTSGRPPESRALVRILGLVLSVLLVIALAGAGKALTGPTPDLGPERVSEERSPSPKPATCPSVTGCVEGSPAARVGAR